jgi:hypothetical protein
MVKRDGLVGGLGRARGTDPRVKRLLEGAASNLAARTSKQRRDAERVRVKLDVPETVKAMLAETAGEINTSSSQLGAFLLAWGLVLCLTGDEEMAEYLGDHCLASRALRVAVDVDLGSLLETLTKLADAVGDE